MLVHLKYGAENLASLQAGLIGELVAQVQQLREGQGNDLIKVHAILARLEPINFAYRQQALHTGKYRRNVARVQQLHSDVEEVGPILGEVIGKYFL